MTQVAEPNGGGQRPPTPISYLGLGFELVVPVVLLMFAGRWLDGRLGSEPWMLVAGAILGMAVGFYSMFRRVISPRRGGNDD